MNIWFVRWIVLKEAAEAIWSISFHAKPLWYGSAGFHHVGQEIDDEDGSEEIIEISFQKYQGIL